MKNTKNKNAFSLIELSIVVTITGFMMSAFLAVLPNIILNYKNIRNNKKLEYIRSAILAYSFKTGKLPIPTNMTANFDSEPEKLLLNNIVDNVKKINNSNILIGGLPVFELGLSPDYLADEWNNKIVYLVNLECAQNSTLCYNIDSSKMLKYNDNTYTINDIAVAVITNNTRIGTYKLNGTRYSSSIGDKNTYDTINDTIYKNSKNNMIILNKLSIFPLYIQQNNGEEDE